ncbi:unnamed protein product, partial [Ectocarpus sp. 12 AP-2014]
MERGLSQWEVRKVLPVMRRDPELVTDIGVLAARMQAIADLLEAAGSWHATAGEPAAAAAAAAAETGSLVSSGVTHDGGSPSSLSPTKATEKRHVGGSCSNCSRSSSSSRGDSSQEQQNDDRS